MKSAFGKDYRAKFGVKYGEVIPVAETAEWPRPIPVSERLPTANVHDIDEVLCSDLVLAFAGTWYPAWFYCDRNQCMIETDGAGDVIVTHWLPLPPNPE